MATSKLTGLRYADLPSIGLARFPDNIGATRAFEQMREALEIRFGKSGAQVDRAVTWGDLVENGIVTMRGRNGKPIGVSLPAGEFLPILPSMQDGIPPAPTGLTVTAGIATVILTWDKPTFSYFGYAEIWRSTENNLANAVMVGQTTAWIYADQVTSSATYYYWVRFVSVGGKIGPYNAAQGMQGEASLDPAYLIDVLSATDPKALLYKVQEPTIINGVPVPSGVYMRDLYVANGSISNAKIGNAAIDDAKVANLSAAKVTFGEMSGDRIATNSLNADRIVVNTLSARLAQITSAYVGTANINSASITLAKIANAAIDNAKIVDAAVTSAKIADAAIVNAKIADAAITNGKIANAAITNAKIADASITSAKIVDAAITNAKIGLAEVDTLRLKNNSVTVQAFASGTVNSHNSLTCSISLSNPGDIVVLLHFRTKASEYLAPDYQLRHNYSSFRTISLGPIKVSFGYTGHDGSQEILRYVMVNNFHMQKYNGLAGINTFTLSRDRSQNPFVVSILVLAAMR